MSTGKTFGAFFRAKRKALGITLREFCRRNGFDPGNVSRLERGLVPPPQAPATPGVLRQSAENRERDLGMG